MGSPAETIRRGEEVYARGLLISTVAWTVVLMEVIIGLAVDSGLLLIIALALSIYTIYCQRNLTNLRVALDDLRKAL